MVHLVLHAGDDADVNTLSVDAEKTAEKIAALVGVRRELVRDYTPAVTR